MHTLHCADSNASTELVDMCLFDGNAALPATNLLKKSAKCEKMHFSSTLSSSNAVALEGEKVWPFNNL